MGLATLLNLPTTPELLTQFSFANQDSHRKIAAAAFAQKNGVVLPVYPVDPIPLFGGGIQVFGYNHQVMHDAMDALLGIQGQDLTGLNFENEAQLSAWIQQHFIEHYQAETMLGVT